MITTIGSTFNPPLAEVPRSRCQRLQDYFAEIRRTVLYSKVAQRVPIAIELSKATLNTFKSQAFVHILQAMGAPQNTASSDWTNHPRVLSLAGHARLFVVAAMIASIYTSVEQAIEIKDEVGKKRAREGIDASLRLVEAVSVLGDSIASFSLGLSMAGIVKASQIFWATPLAGVSTIFSVASLALEFRGLNQSREIYKKLHKSGRHIVGGTSNEPLQWLKEELTDSQHRDGAFYLRRHFEIINREKYSAQILSIIDDKSSDRDTKQAELVKVLKKRTKNKIKGHRLAIISLIVGLIGAAIFFSPYLGIMSFASLSVLGLSITAISATIAFYKYMKDYRSIRKLEKKIDELCPFNTISPEWMRKNATFAIPLLSSLSPTPQRTP